MRVVAAMSGGVDSAVAASRMIEAGHDVVGVHLALAKNAKTLREGARGCCTIEDAGDARRVADRLGIPFYVWDMATPFARDVVDDFVAEYEAGRTPNPCLRCNEKIKFAALLDKITSPATIVNPFRSISLINHTASSFIVGDGDHVWHLARVALAMGSGVDTETVPIGGFQDTVVGNVVLWDDEGAQQLWDSMK